MSTSILRPTSTFLALLAAGAFVLAGCARGKTTEAPFSAVSLTAANARAQSEGKLVFVDVWAAWCGPCKLLDSTTWKDRSVIDLLSARTIAIKINADQDSAFVEKYKVEALPTLLVLKPDGSEVTRVVGYVDAAGFQARLGATLAAAD